MATLAKLESDATAATHSAEMLDADATAGLRSQPDRIEPAGRGWRMPAYIDIARPDHWFKNGFMVLGVILAYFYQPALFSLSSLGTLFLAVAATCVIASSNYVINEILDSPSDQHHPVKHRRPIPSGRVQLPWAYAEWIALGGIGLAMAWSINLPFFLSGAMLLIMGMIYNIPPIRSKDLPYLDVTSEAINNPIRLALGWFATGHNAIPPMSLLISYWMIGAFFMGTKRFAEYRSIGDPARAAAYRESFRHYDENRLLISGFFYATAAALFLGIFIVRHHLELILSIPLMAGFFAYYLRIALRHDSPVQAPERLYREKGLMLYLAVCLTVFVGLMFVRIPVLYDWFGPQPSGVPILWEF